jgi:hypothetical protein
VSGFTGNRSVRLKPNSSRVKTTLRGSIAVTRILPNASPTLTR